MFNSNNGPNGHLFYVGGDLMMRRGMLPIIMLPDGDLRIALHLVPFWILTISKPGSLARQRWQATAMPPCQHLLSHRLQCHIKDHKRVFVASINALHAENARHKHWDMDSSILNISRGKPNGSSSSAIKNRSWGLLHLRVFVCNSHSMLPCYIIQLLVIGSQQICAHATTAHTSCDMCKL